MKDGRTYFSSNALKTNIIFDIESIYLVINQGFYSRKAGGNLGNYTPYKKRFIQMVHTFDGGGKIKVNGKIFQCKPNTVIFVDYQDSPTLETSGGFWDYGIIWFFSENLDFPINEVLEAPMVKGERARFKKIVSLIDKREYISTAQANGLTLALVAEILSKTNFTSDKQYKQDVRKVMEKINASTDEKLTVEGLAKSVHLSEKHFRLLFERFVGMSPKQYITKAKMEKAIFYLKNTTMSIEEIAENLAYSSTTHFIITFNKLYGVTPLNFRKGR